MIQMSHNILWIEDDYYHVKGLIKPLINEGHKFIIAKSYIEATEYLTKWQDFSVIILDLIIPYSEKEIAYPDEQDFCDPAENGMKLFFYMKRDLKITIPIVILSVVKNQQKINELMASGAAKWLEKGFLLPNDVKSEIHELLGIDE